MRIVPFLFSTAVTTGLIIALNVQLPSGKTKTPRLGFFLSPQRGFWQNAEPANVSFDKNIRISGIKDNADVYFDDRLVPHIYAANDADAYFIQGYLHAKFRLWQMEFQTYAAGGRLSEIIGESMLPTDKYFRRLGMVYGAEQALDKMSKDAETKTAMDAYTDGVNAYIGSLKENEIPFEYKLLDYRPEPWTNLKTALFLKFMSFDLTGQGDDDLLMTNTKNLLGWETFKRLFPQRADSLDPIIPKGTAFEKPGITIQPPSNVDSLYFLNSITATETLPPVIPNKNNGSNNWAVSGNKTKSGKPILCNDPHLGLNLPSLWYEIQITTPTHNTYGASFPGAPCVIIGFNDSIAWGVTNAGRDVKDFYELKFKDSTMQEYWFNGAWKKAETRKEVIKIKGRPDDVENIAMTIFGPVMYDQSYKNKNEDGKCIAVRWTAHDPSNELHTFFKLNHSKNYTDYVNAISSFDCPGQNFAFASVSGDIAIHQQGKFVAKWNRQGDFVMPGTDSAFLWQGYIPVNENPHILNPARGFVSSANQMAVDSTYPYYLGKSANFPVWRGYLINRNLSTMSNITPEDMQKLQTNNYNVVAELIRPALLHLVNRNKLNNDEKKCLEYITKWDLQNDTAQKAPTIFKLWWDSIYRETYNDKFTKLKQPVYWPEKTTLIEALLRSNYYEFADNMNTTDVKETMTDVVTSALHQILPVIREIEKDDKLEWAKYKATYINHLLKIPALSRLDLPIGGGADEINATTSNHGPSWRMVVQLTTPIEAYAVYPGGQSGNPGSRYYDSFVNSWALGKYYAVLFLKKQEAIKHPRIKWHISFEKA
jgi:penicillin amidase